MGLLDICYYFSYNQRSVSTILGEMTDADKVKHPQRFGTDPTVIRTQINLGIRIGVLDHCLLKILALVEVCAL